VLQLFEEMRKSNLKPGEKVLSTTTLASGQARNLSCEKAINDFIIGNNIVLDTY
jgi:DNA-binding transcriptional regulator YhcF (GntR family)